MKISLNLSKDLLFAKKIKKKIENYLARKDRNF